MSLKRARKKLAREKNFRRFEASVLSHARTRSPKIFVGETFGRGKEKITVTGVGTHTVTYETGDGWRGHVQIPFVGSRGEALPSRERAGGGW